MNIAWLYLDKRSAAINALKDYVGMKYIVDNIHSEIVSAQADMMTIGSPAISDRPKGPYNPHAMENKVIKAMDTISVLNERYQRALEYMSWFLPAWNSLTEDERFVLQQFYLNDENRQTDNLIEICDHFHIERTSAYKKKDRALARLTLMLYGK